MSKPIAVILFAILAIAIFALGGGLGMFYQSQQSAVVPNSAQCTEKMASAVKALSSPVIPSIIAYGQASNISGRDITVFSNGQNLTIRVRDDAKISIIASAIASANNTTKIADFKDIKKGDTLNIMIKVLPDGSFEGQSVYILPVGAK